MIVSSPCRGFSGPHCKTSDPENRHRRPIRTRVQETKTQEDDQPKVVAIALRALKRMFIRAQQDGKTRIEARFSFLWDAFEDLGVPFPPMHPDPSAYRTSYRALIRAEIARLQAALTVSSEGKTWDKQ